MQKSQRSAHMQTILPTNSRWFPVSAATKITCNFPFNQLLAAASPHCNSDFPQNLILRFIQGSPFAPVQSLKAVLDTNCFNFYKKHACAEL